MTKKPRLKRAIQKALARQNPTIFLKADREVPYGTVVRVMAVVRHAGIEQLGMVTEPEALAR